MENASLVFVVRKLAIIGEQAGFSQAEMIELLNAGISVKALLQLFLQCLDGRQPEDDNSRTLTWMMPPSQEC